MKCQTHRVSVLFIKIRAYQVRHTGYYVTMQSRLLCFAIRVICHTGGYGPT